MWRSLSIRWQLIILVSLVLLLVEAGTLGMAYWFDVKERKALALEQVETLGRALQHDLLRALLNPQADVYSDISFRLSGFQSVQALSALDASGSEVYRYSRVGARVPADLLQRSSAQPYFSGDLLYLRQPLAVDGHRFGEVVQLIDLSSYHTQLQDQLITLVVIFKIELLIGLLLAWWISRTHTRPFTELAEAMCAADVQNNRFRKVATGARNEIGVLYDGYNRMIDQVVRSTGDLKYYSEHDSLTGLYNRHAIERAISVSLQQGDAGSHVLLSLDIDQFKLLNDAAGHVAGDALLKQVGRICQSLLPEQALLARVGGDDFFVLVPGADEALGRDIGKRLIEALRDYRFVWNDGVYSVSVSVGLLAFKPFEYTLEALLTAVDTAFYAAKAAGLNQLHVYRQDDEKVQQYSQHVQAAAIIKEALHGGASRFELFAQAIVPLQTASDQISYEILLRLRNASGELVSPGAFLPTAERYQLMSEIDTFVLWRYLETVAAHPEHVAQLDFVNINLAGGTLNNGDFQASVREAVAHFDFPWHKLVLEVTETSAVGNLASASGFIGYCRDLGMRVALDDFGTGMASFEYLKHLPLDVVKIDGSFIRDMLTDPLDHAMVSYAHEISKLRGHETIAEFVEQPEHVAALRRIGVDYGQGYYLGRPRPLLEWLADGRQSMQVTG